MLSTISGWLFSAKSRSTQQMTQKRPGSLSLLPSAKKIQLDCEEGLSSTWIDEAAVSDSSASPRRSESMDKPTSTESDSSTAGCDTLSMLAEPCITDPSVNLSDPDLEDSQKPGPIEDMSAATDKYQTSYSTGLARQRTSIAIQDLKERYQVTISQSQFIGLCAYLCALLRFGYPTTIGKLDHFICGYEAFASALAAREEAQTATGSHSIASYHEWFLERSDWQEAEQPIITEDCLRQIWAENPFRFLVAKVTLQCIGQRDLHRQYVGR